MNQMCYSNPCRLPERDGERRKAGMTFEINKIIKKWQSQVLVNFQSTLIYSHGPYVHVLATDMFDRIIRKLISLLIAE